MDLAPFPRIFALKKIEISPQLAEKYEGKTFPYFESGKRLLFVLERSCTTGTSSSMLTKTSIGYESRCPSGSPSFDGLLVKFGRFPMELETDFG